MNNDPGLVGCLVERLTTRLPHRTGTQDQDLHEDDVAATTRATLVRVSATSPVAVLEPLVSLLEDLGRPYKGPTTHPAHILASEIYLLKLIADCCLSNWQSIREPGFDTIGLGAHFRGGQKLPKPLPNLLVTRIFDYIRMFMDPIPDDYVLPARYLVFEAHDVLDPIPSASGFASRAGSSNSSTEELRDFGDRLPPSISGEVGQLVRTIVAYISAGNWAASFDYLRNTIYRIRNVAAAHAGMQPMLTNTAQEERYPLGVLQLLAFFWVDSQKLVAVIQELSSNFLHLRKSYQTVIAIATPGLIASWMLRYSDEYASLHNGRRKLDSSVDTLFDMSLTLTDNSKRRTCLHQFQCTLLSLMPDVFEVAGNFRDAKTGSLTKKVGYLEGLQKGFHNRSDTVIQCFVGFVRNAPVIGLNSDCAIVSYALDIQDEVRDAVFRKSSTNPAQSMFDQDLITCTFICLAESNVDESIEPLVQICLQPNAPQTFKIALVQSCTYFAKRATSERYRTLFAGSVAFIQNQFKASCNLLMERHIGEPESKRKTAETEASNKVMLLNVLKFLRARPAALFESPPTGAAESDLFYQQQLEAIVIVLSVADEDLRAFSQPLAQDLDRSGVLDTLRQTKRLISSEFKAKYIDLCAAVTDSLCDKLIHQLDVKSLRALQGQLECRPLLQLTRLQELYQNVSPIDRRVQTVQKLETTFFVSLCSPDLDICQIVVSCFAFFVHSADTHQNLHDAGKIPSHTLRNREHMGLLATKEFRFPGVVAFQKRIRAVLRGLQYPTIGLIEAWEIAFNKWIHLSKDVTTTPADSIEETGFSEWRNLSGFLASLGGVCTSDQIYMLEDSQISLRWIDQLSSEHTEEPVLSRFLRLSIQLLASTNVRVRETIREVLSSEISSNLYQHLFKALESEVDVLFTGALEESGRGQDIEIIFAEQAASLLRGLVDRLESPSEMGAASSVHLGSLALGFAKFMDGVAETTSSLRVKIKVCQLCESVTRKKEHLNLRDDVRIRNQLLEFVFSWIARPKSPRAESGLGLNRHDDSARVQKDLDRAALKCLSELTFRLPLQPGDGQSDVGTSELKSHMFQTYFNRFLFLLNDESMEGKPETSSHSHDSVPLPDLVITILSNLLSANIDVGLKHSLSIGYHEKVEIRTAFVKVLYNILVQGTEFNNLSDAAVSEKYEALLDILTQDMSLAVAVSTVCPSGEVDEIAIALLSIFETRGMAFELMEALVRQEIEDTENESELLRRNCVPSKMISSYAKWKGSAYLKATLQKVIERLMLTSKDLDLELDPSKVTSQEELQKNAMQLRIVAKVFIDDICASSAFIPPAFRKICSIISSAVMPRFPEAKYTAVGSFIFLRFFCPAIVAPESENLVSSTPSKEMRRGLLLIAKVIQNLANNVLFGAKEPYLFSLNDFLTQNIYRVTTFLREISVEPGDAEIAGASSGEAFDFGSCVAMHRFLYDHWDHVRQKLMYQERREVVRSPNELARGRSPVMEPVRALITSLGPPPLAVTWNRPQINSNNPLAYSRFQHFMLRNAFRGSESHVTTRAVYDGGESKDGLSIICIILRHLDQDSIDYDTLLYCYLKIASRLWHKPFGLLIDATCYNGQNEPPDEIFKKLELLSPNELSQHLTRVYVYNMNSTFRKCFRRILRVATRNESSVFNPGNVEYHLMGNLQDLQTHFHLSQLHLPKETISVVTDTRYVFQPVTRLSKTKGKIEVVIKVGSQFVQVTTTKKQEVHPGFRLNAVVNDIFRLGDVDEAPTSIPTEDDSAFGLRADNGKIVMYFQSGKKQEVISSIRAAKAKYGKDTRTTKSVERLIRPQDVPGTLLNLALTNLAAADPVLRVSSYNLLGALCRAFDFKAASQFICLKGKCFNYVFVPLDPTRFIVNISKRLALEEPQLTSDFLNEFFVGWESFSDEQKPLSLAYMAPWIPSLRTALLGEETDSEKGKEKIAGIFQKLIDVTATDPSLGLILEHTVWPAIHKDETLLDIFLEEVIKGALSLGLHDENTQSLTAIITAMGTVTLRGKIIARLRKALNRSSLRPTRVLPENAVWSEICVLLQFCLALSFDSPVQAQLYLPEVFHIVTMLANTGTSDIRTMVHRLLINTVHAASTSFKLDDAKGVKLRSSLDALSESRNEIFSAAQTLARDAASIHTNTEGVQALGCTETLAGMLFEICAVAAPSVDMANAWRSRWMSLVASTAFQNNPAIQPRAFTVMGCLAREEVDDDLLYQVLVALRNSISRFGEDGSFDMLIAIVTSLSKMMSRLPSASRYGVQLFWLAMSLLRLVPSSLFSCTASFLDAVLANIGTTGEFSGNKMADVLLTGRMQLEEAAIPLDEVYGIQFTPENFHLSVCACLVRGLTDTVTKNAALRVLSTFLEMTTNSARKSSDDLSRDYFTSPYLALIQARAVSPEEMRDVLWSAGISPVGVASLAPTRRLRDLESLKDKDLLLYTAIELVDFQSLEDAAQNHTLTWLNELATGRPSVVVHLCSQITSMLDDILLHCQNTSTLESAYALLKTLSSNPKFSGALESANSMLDEILEDMGFGGLWKSCSTRHSEGLDKHSVYLTEKLIELIIV
ncbi:GTPase-activator protein for ras-like GTPase [Microdochium bolleyi]|uniref:GTPase-activator protein for ras-like GTPase n=1 Tax=Microdochium bolleyi TaxID=196109 RepID=A0A136JHD3_9PEZI|nr:GTPase-activator protein for ras-like GTPase [Microdochium bolleyi]